MLGRVEEWEVRARGVSMHTAYSEQVKCTRGQLIDVFNCQIFPVRYF